MSQLPVSGVLDQATLRQMTRPRCGVADTDSHAAWAERISALFAGHRAKMRRKKRFAKPGECTEIQLGWDSPVPRRACGQEVWPNRTGTLRESSLASDRRGADLLAKDHNHE